MKIAIMQPYFMPYIGYFQLINAVDKFVFYDDVNFIKKGWVNRNKILVNEKEYLFSVPLEKISQNNLINNSFVNIGEYNNWRLKFLKTLYWNYKRAPNYKEAIALIEKILFSKFETISELSIYSIIEVSKHLNLNTEFIISSQKYQNKDMEKQERLIDICKQEKANHYINAIGGQELYSKKTFKNSGLQLSFIKSVEEPYKQFNNNFIPWLSIIDVLMFNFQDNLNTLLTKFVLI